MNSSNKFFYKIFFFTFLFFLSVNYRSYTSEKLPSPQKFCLIQFGDANWKDYQDLLQKLDIIVVDYYRFPAIPEDIKKINPKIKVFAYINVFDMTDLSRFDSSAEKLEGKTKRMYGDWKYFNDKENLFLHDFRGKRISVFLNKNVPRYALDISEGEVAGFFAMKISHSLSSGYDGVFLDNVWVKYPFSFGLGNWISGVPPLINKDKWSGQTANLLAELKKQSGVGKVIFNQINPSDIVGSMKYLNASDGASDEEWLKNNFFYGDNHSKSLTLISNAAKREKDILLLSSGETYGQRLFYYSAYLLVADGKNVFFQPSNKHNIERLNFDDFYKVPMGIPLSRFIKKGEVYYRAFENALVIVNFGKERFDTRDIAVSDKANYEIKFGSMENFSLLPQSAVIMVRKK